jgi:NAD(P)-dependent dehydrogenase (short-subunit alcohol dehydrogenase family)
MSEMSNISFDFTGRTVIISGAARGIGLAMSKRFGDAGASVWMVDLDADALHQAAAWIGAQAARRAGSGSAVLVWPTRGRGATLVIQAAREEGLRGNCALAGPGSEQ